MYIATYIPPPGNPFYDLSHTACHLAELDTHKCVFEQDGNLHSIFNGDFNARTASYQINRECCQMDGDDYDELNKTSQHRELMH